VRASGRQIVSVTLDLDEREARWLMTLVQNPVGCEPDEEDEQSRKYREGLFHAIKDQLP
jgi:hypothetical protein